MATMAVDQRHRMPSRRRDAWRAVEQRDASYDGRFVYAVRSTRHLLPPVVPVASAAARERRASFDDGRRRRARGLSRVSAVRAARRTRRFGSAQAIDEARAYLDAHMRPRPCRSPSSPTHVGLSASHLQRSFKRIGRRLAERISGRATACRRFKSRLRAGDTVSRATYEAGSARAAAYTSAPTTSLGMTPAAYRRGGAGVRIRYTIADAPIGRVLVGDDGAWRVRRRARRRRTPTSSARCAPISRTRRSSASDDDARHVGARGARSVRDPRHARDASNSARRRRHGVPASRCGRRCRKSRPGERRSYAEVAAAIGRPTATRAVARACASNRIAVVVPCHRVVRGDGELSGYKWGQVRKRQLLETERG